jgi:50S ribosomal protein L16 3-hydroxylase
VHAAAYAALSKPSSTESFETDPLKIVLGISKTVFLRRYADREALHAQGTVQRFRKLLDTAFIKDRTSIDTLIRNYSGTIRLVAFDTKGFLRYKTVNMENSRLTDSLAACYFLFDYDGHFKRARSLLESLCVSNHYTREGSNCRGSLHTPGAFVPRHCDELDVLVLQICGKRSWRIETNDSGGSGIHEAVRLPGKLRNGWAAAFSSASRLINLEPGSALYVPRGWWHETRSSRHSFAITFGLVPESLSE